MDAIDECPDSGRGAGGVRAGGVRAIGERAGIGSLVERPSKALASKFILWSSTELELRSCSSIMLEIAGMCCVAAK